LHRSAGKVGDREDRPEDRVQTFVRAPALGFVNHQELVIGSLLNLDEVRHLCDFRDFTKKLAYAPTTIKGKGLSHRRSFKIASGPATDGVRWPVDLPSIMVFSISSHFPNAPGRIAFSVEFETILLRTHYPGTVFTVPG
jgi:hypothetical protein